ncbi:MAG: winged helix-turn-helix transcriptional regulator [Cocleimonas sp.]|nr:winged helix-turn-helix transcriptional regulator [Cocleimonas sp.]
MNTKGTEFTFTQGLFAGNDTDQIYPSIKVMGHPMRLKILCLIAHKEICVKDITSKLGTTQSNISQHLRILKDGGVVASRKMNNYSFYHITSPVILQIFGSKSPTLQTLE